MSSSRLRIALQRGHLCLGYTAIPNYCKCHSELVLMPFRTAINVILSEAKNLYYIPSYFTGMYFSPVAKSVISGSSLFLAK